MRLLILSKLKKSNFHHLLILLIASVSSFTFAKEKVKEGKAVDSVEVIKVTGSKVKRSEYFISSPTIVLSPEDFQHAGVNNLADLLNELPMFSVGLSPESFGGAQRDNKSSFFDSGLNYTDLRDLGHQRTLVLVNGRRFVAGSPGSLSVDLNSIPLAMVRNVEVVTGGTSAIYGANALAGVVNIITKDAFDGVEIEASTLRPFESGGEQEHLSITFGESYQRSSFITNLSYAKQRELKATQRDFIMKGPVEYDSAGNLDNFDGIPRRSILSNNWGEAVDIRATPYGTVWLADKPYVFDESGAIRPSTRNNPFPEARDPFSDNKFYSLGVGDGLNQAKYHYLITPSKRFNLMSNFNYDWHSKHSMNIEVDVR